MVKKRAHKKVSTKRSNILTGALEVAHRDAKRHERDSKAETQTQSV